MPICTYLSDWEARNIEIEHKEVRELLAEVRKVSGINWVVREYKFEEGRWWWKKVRVVYNVLNPIVNGEYQIINFYRDGTKWSINTYVPAELVIAYFYGILSKNRAKMD